MPVPGRGKSGLHRIRMLVNGQRGRPQGKCHRKQTASLRRGKGEKVRQERTAGLATGPGKVNPIRSKTI